MSTGDTKRRSATSSRNSGSSSKEPRAASAQSKTAWSDDAMEGMDNEGYETYGGSALSMRQEDDEMAAMESEPYLGAIEDHMAANRTSKPKVIYEDEDEGIVAEGCWSKFTEGVQSMWVSKRTVDDLKNDKDLYIKTTLRELLVYLIFLTVLGMLTFGMTSSTMFYYTKIMSELFLDAQFSDTKSTFRALNHPYDFWRFAEGPLMDGLYWESWYNSRNLTESEKGYIYYENKLLGVPRLRQVRVKNNTCVLDPKFDGEVNGCYGMYADSIESQVSFGLKNSTSWVYATQEELDGSGHPGSVSYYRGGGFVRNLASTKAESLQVIADLRNNLWIDRATRAVFVDFTVYNANINLFCVIRMLVEFPATGGAVPSWAFRTVKLIRYVTVWDYAILACECVFILFTFYYSVEEFLEIKKRKFKYLKEFWNVLDLFVLVVSYVCIGFSVYRTITVNRMLDILLANPADYADFEFLAYWQSQFNNTIAVAVFFSWIKIFKYISFNKTMTQLSTTLSRCSKDLLGFSIMFIIMFFSFAQLGNLLFGPQIDGFSTVPSAFFTLFRIILGDFDFYALQNANRVLGPIYFALYVFFVFFIILNMFLAIINDTYSEVKADETVENDFEMGEFLRKGYTKMLSKMRAKKTKIVDLQTTLEEADANGDRLLDFNEWRNDLKKKGYADTEIETMFAKYDTDGNRVLDQDEQRALAKDLQQMQDNLNSEFTKLEAKAQGDTPDALKDLIDSEEEGPDEEEEDDEDEALNRKAKSAVANRRDRLTTSVGPRKPAAPVKKKKDRFVEDGVPYDEYAILARRVDRMEHSIGSIVAKIDAVLVKLDTMEMAKQRRKDTMNKLLDSILEGEGEENTDDDRKSRMEQLVADELARWDEDVDASRADLQGGRSSRAGTSASYR